MAKEKGSGWDDPANEVQSSWVKFNVPMEDKIHGTLIAKRQVQSMMPGKEGTKNWAYDIKADEVTHYHKLDDSKKLIEEPVEVVVGGVYSVGGTSVIDRQMQNIRVGQVIGLKYIEEVPAKKKGFNPAKVIRVYAPKNADGSPQMDEEFLKQAELDNFGN